MKSLPYYDDLTARQTIKLRELIKTLPPFAKEFFRAIDSTTQVRTRIAYAYDLRVFFHFLIDENPAYRNYSVLDFKVSDLDKIESVVLPRCKPLNIPYILPDRIVNELKKSSG